MRNVVFCALLAAAAIAAASVAPASTGESGLAPWQPPTIYQTNLWYTKTASFTVPYNATNTYIWWQLEWNVNGSYGMPPGVVVKICDAAQPARCTLITNPTVDGTTTFFAGESASQTFTFYFEIPAAQTKQVGPYIGYAANSDLAEYYQY